MSWIRERIRAHPITWVLVGILAGGILLVGPIWFVINAVKVKLALASPA